MARFRLAFLLLVVFPAAGRAAELSGLDALYPSLDALYQDLHRNPELSNHEVKTAAKMAAKLKALGFEVTEHVGGNGVVGVLRNGPGPTVLVRTDMDALPIKEQTGLPYASTVTVRSDAGEATSVMHACGHDIHMASWVGAATLLSRAKNLWHGTLLFVGQPAEELVTGAEAMVKDGLFTRFPKPNFIVGLHDVQLLASGQVGVSPGASMAASNAVEITFYGVGGHAATPQRTIDPIVMAARTVVTLQTIVSRETSPFDPAVVSVGTFHAGTKGNIIPDEARLELTVRSFKPEVQKSLLAAIERIAKAEALAARAPREPAVVVNPKIASEVVYNDPALTDRMVTMLKKHLGAANVIDPLEPSTASEDFGVYGRAAGAPSVFFRIGASDPAVLAKLAAVGQLPPGPHNAKFAPDRERTIRTGVTTMTLAVLELLGGGAGATTPH